MKTKIFLIIFICLGLTGCATTTLYKIASVNTANLSGLSKGMTKEEALKIMGTETKTTGLWDWYKKIKNPYKSETLRGKDKTLEVIYYFTTIEKNRLAGERPIIDNTNLTPLIFDNGILIGWDWGSFYGYIKEYGLE